MGDSSASTTPAHKYRDKPQFWTHFPDAIAPTTKAGKRAPKPNHLTNNHPQAPIPGITTWNVNGLSAHSPRYHRITQRIHHLARSQHIIFLQETHLEPLDCKTLQAELPGWKLFYSNKTSKSGGVLTAIPPQVLLEYKCTQVPLSPEVKGHALLIACTHKHNPHHGAPSINLFNVYLYTGKTRQPTQTTQLNALCKAPSAGLNVVAGDFNFVLAPTDTSNPHGPKPMTKLFEEAWNAFTSRYHLVEHRQDLHTYYHLTSAIEHSHTSRIDRIYTSLNEVDIEIFKPSCSVVSCSPAISDFLARRAKPDAPPATVLTKHTGGCDHLAVSLNFKPAVPPSRLPAIPKWVCELPEFNKRVREQWKPPDDWRADQDPFSKLNEFKQHLHDVYQDLRREGILRWATCKDKLEEFRSGLRLLRELMRPALNYTSISLLLTATPELGAYISGRFSAGTVDTSALKTHLNNLLHEHATVEHANSDKFEQLNQQQQPPTPSKAQILKLQLPSSRQRLTGLRPEGPESEPTNDPQEMAKTAKKFWGALWENDCRISEEENSAYCSRATKAKPHSQLPRPTEQDIIDVILDTNNSAPGPDGIPFRAYRANAPLVAPIFEAVFTTLSQGVKPPRGFNYANLFLLPKKLTMLIEHTRPISVTNTDNRIMAKTLVSVMLPHLQARLNLAQKGSIAGRQGADHVRELADKFYEAAEGQTSNLHVLFLDTRKAFDSIHHRFIFAALKHIGLPDWVITVMRGLLHQVAVTPIFNGYTDVWIGITRGVKQGCPTSPLVFAACLDIIINRLQGFSDIQVWAYVDDMAIGTHSVRNFARCMRALDAFTKYSGLGLNRDKTKLVSARYDAAGVDAEIWLASKHCPWRDKGIAAARQYTYLGVLIGRDVELTDVWRPVVHKAISRLARYGTTLRSLTLGKRIEVYNIFVYPLFSYLAPFYNLPDSSYYEVTKAVRSAILPFGRTGAKYAHFIAPVTAMSPATPLKDLWAGTRVALIEQGDLSRYHQVDDVPDQALRYSSMRPSTQVASAVHEFVNMDLDIGSAKLGAGQCSTFNADLYAQRTGPKRREALYALIIRYYLRYDQRDLDTRQKLKKRNLPASTGDVDNLMAHFEGLRKTMPGPARYHQMLMLLNAVNTSRRNRHVRRAKGERGEVACCHLCHTQEDSLEHLFQGQCHITTRALDMFSHIICYSLTPASLGVPDMWHATFLCFDSSKQAQAHAIIIFNWAVWMRICKKYARRPCPTEAKAVVQDIVYFALTFWHKVCKPSWTQPLIAPCGGNGQVGTTGAAGKRTDAQAARALQNAIDLVAAIPPGAFIIYTDGGAAPNPGPAGAGILIQKGSREVEIVVALGEGTNNIGELWAIGASCAWLTNQQDTSAAYFISDSSYALQMAQGQARPKTNKALVHAVRASVKRTQASRRVLFGKTAGHCGLPGNDRADALATLGVQRSRRGHGMQDQSDYYINGEFCINNCYTAVNSD
jgi:ribonuclease HI/exonuclease III